MHKKNLKKQGLIAISALLFAAASSVSSTEVQNRIKTVVDAAIEPVITEYNVPGMAVAAVVNGTRYYFNYGVTSKLGGKPVSQDTIFEIGSVSKTFTATLASYAQVNGALSLSDHPSKHFPTLHGTNIDKVSLLDLGTYAAGGLPLQFPNEVDDDKKMQNYFKKWKPTFEPGTHRLYSNPSIGLFGFLAARSLGKPFDRLMEENVFPKLGLIHTYVKVPESQLTNYAQGYTRDDKATRVSPGVFDSEAYGVKTTSADMIQFVGANMSAKGIDESFQRAIAGTHKGYVKVGDMTQGLGWEMYSYPIELDRLLAGNSSKMILEANEVTTFSPPLQQTNTSLINKTGSTNGFGAYVAFVPARGIGIVMLANKNYPNEARVRAAFRILTELDRQFGVAPVGGSN